MANIRLSNSNGYGSLDDEENWINDDTSEPLGRAPQANDFAFIDSNTIPNGGVLPCPVQFVGYTTYVQGIYNGPATVNNFFMAEYSGCTFNAEVTVTGTFGGPATCNAPVHHNVSSPYNGIGDAVIITDRLHFVTSGTILYAPTSPAVAPASKVRQGTSNLGVPGVDQLPATGDVKDNVHFGANGTEFRGTMPGGGGSARRGGLWF